MRASISQVQCKQIERKCEGERESELCIMISSCMRVDSKEVLMQLINVIVYTMCQSPLLIWQGPEAKNHMAGAISKQMTKMGFSISPVAKLMTKKCH